MSTWQVGVWAALLATLTILVPSPAIHAIQREEPSLDIVLARAADYVTKSRRFQVHVEETAPTRN